MVSRSVKFGRSRNCQNGLTLLELVLALSLGSLIILGASQVLLSVVTASSAVQRRILVEEKLLELQLLLSKELRRAGYHSRPNQAATFSDQNSLVYVNAAHNDVGLVYQVKSSGAEAFRNLYFDYSPSGKQLKLCDKYSATPLSTTQAATSTTGSSCYSLFDSNQFRLTHFQVELRSVASAAHHSAMLTVDMALALTGEPQIQHAIHFNVMQRNWL